jgi:CBS domain-containing protein
MTETERFLKDFKALEDKMVSLSNLSGGFVSFSRALDRVHEMHLNPIVSNDDNYYFLKTASDMRNILSHENDACIPTTDFTDRFEKMADEIINPLSAYDIATKSNQIIYATKSSNLKEIAALMVENHLSHVPVMDKGVVIGVFSQTTFFQEFYQNGKIKADESFAVADFMDAINYESHLNESYVFVARRERANALLRFFIKTKPGAKRVSVIFVTETGNKNERLLGLISETDLLKLPLYERKMLRS